VTSATSESPQSVLTQPTRARLFARLSRLGRPSGTVELAAELGLHPSGVRVHLERLHAAGLIVRERQPQPRGRPRDSWQIASDRVPSHDPPDAYQQLARLLVASIPARPARLREVERSGQELGRQLLRRGGAATAEETLARLFTVLGFAPQREQANAATTVFKLGSCPYREAARENPSVVCALHRGITIGLLQRLDPAGRLKAFLPSDPDRGGCLIEVQGLDGRRAPSRRRRESPTPQHPPPRGATPN
jgi:predicted ArsR family transcriptional regulator